MDGVIRIEAACEPRDVLANRLDPWHGESFHPYSFGALEVLEDTGEVLTVRVEKKIVGPLRVEVDATFHCPDARTIVMTIVDGEGKGSVVETHATPTEPGRTAIVEATLATSDRPGFRHALRVARLVRPFIERSARRLWVDDAAYAERLAELRRRGWSAAGDAPPKRAVRRERAQLGRQ
jgi:isorenieratene synthase